MLWTGLNLRVGFVFLQRYWLWVNSTIEWRSCYPSLVFCEIERLCQTYNLIQAIWLDLTDVQQQQSTFKIICCKSVITNFVFLQFSMRYYAINWCDKLRFIAFICISLNWKQPEICRTNLQLLQLAKRLDSLTENVLKIHKYSRNYGVYFCPSAQDNSYSGVNNSSLRTQKRLLGPESLPPHRQGFIQPPRRGGELPLKQSYSPLEKDHKIPPVGEGGEYLFWRPADMSTAC